MINVKEYGVVSTDGDHVSVAAPTRDDYYPTMYEVKKEIDKSTAADLSNYYTKQEIDGKGYLTSIPDNIVTEDELPEELTKGGSVLVVPQQVFDNLITGTATEEDVAEAFGLTVEGLEKMFEEITVDGKYTSAVVAIGTDDNSRRYLPANLTVNKGEYPSFGISAFDDRFTYEQFTAVIGRIRNGEINQLNNIGNGYIGYPGIDIEDGSVEESTFEGNIVPNSYYTFGEKTSITINGLNDGYPDRLDEYMFEFTSGDTPTVLTVPETVKWVNEPNIEANKTYQVSIVNNIGIIVGV